EAASDCESGSCSGDWMGLGGSPGFGGASGGGGAPGDGSVCLAPRCTDGVMNGDESDVDCGGTCGPCDDGLDCVVASDCQSGVCGDDDSCAVPECGDGVLNGD